MSRTETKRERKRPTMTKQNTSSYLVEEVTPQIPSVFLKGGLIGSSFVRE